MDVPSSWIQDPQLWNLHLKTNNYLETGPVFSSKPRVFHVSTFYILFIFTKNLKDFEVFLNMDAVSVLEIPNDILYPHLPSGNLT